MHHALHILDAPAFTTVPLDQVTKHNRMHCICMYFT